MVESLNVIALISGGKDSFFSILHCLRNGHRVVALGNLYPETKDTKGMTEEVATSHVDGGDEHDLNSFMYQTVGHTVIPLYEKALGIPLYRQPIIGSAVQTGTTYAHPEVTQTDQSTDASPEEDETESLLPLLQRIMLAHPEANAISTGAILSTYQRTRIESIVIRLSLTPLSYLWQYPVLPPASETALLQDMQTIGLDARIIKVASGGLDEMFLWENVASQRVMTRIEKAMRRFGINGDGAVLGEGGEFETLVLDGPSSLFKGRIEIREEDRRVVREGGGSAWLRILNATVVMKAKTEECDCRVPELLEGRFQDILEKLNEEDKVEKPDDENRIIASFDLDDLSSLDALNISNHETEVIHWYVASEDSSSQRTITQETEQVIREINNLLQKSCLNAGNILSTIIILRNMQDFAAVNKIYGSLFNAPNPPSRVTISAGSSLSANTNLSIHLALHTSPTSSQTRKALHVQSRSYWAPANIGPYSQAISFTPSHSSSSRAVSVAGQIALLPASMALPPKSEFKLQAVLALQHLFRIGVATEVRWWISAVAFLPHGSTATHAQVAGRAWDLAHPTPKGEGDEDEDEDGEEERDLWEERHRAGTELLGSDTMGHRLPDWEIIDGVKTSPPFFAVEVEELPRGAAVEWFAHLGVVSESVKTNSKGVAGIWKANLCTFGTSSHILLSISHSPSAKEVTDRITTALTNLKIPSALAHLCYLDVSVEGLTDSQGYKGAVPCRSIWDGTGSKLAAVMLFDISTFPS